MINIFKISENLQPYTTKQEKQALLYVSEDDWKYSKLLNILGYKDVDKASEDFIKYLILKLRCISVGETVDIQYTCKSCNKITVSNTNLEKLFGKPVYEDIEIGLFSDDEIDKKINENFNLDNLSISKYDEIYAKYEENNTVLFSSNIEAKCIMCEDITVFPLNIKEIISKSTISNLYGDIADLSYYSNNGYNDIMLMLPFEREIIISLINKIREE